MDLHLAIYGRLFVDLDGVMADFDQGYLNLFGHECHHVSDDLMWANIRSIDGFFAGLPMTPGAAEAWQTILPYGPIILTACPEKDYQGIADQKHAWVRRNIPGNPLVLPVMRGVNKARFVQAPGDILIDDFEKNLLPWADAGGMPILHRNWAETLETLRTVMSLKYKDYHDQG